jgi:hypothetical protein
MPRPQFGTVPPIAVDKKGYRGPPFRYKALLDIVREHPGQPAKIGLFRHPQLKVTAEKSTTAKLAVRRWLDKNFPLEHWQLDVRRDTDTFSDRYLWATYLGPWTEAEAEADKAKRVAWAEKQFGAENLRRWNKAARESQRLLRERAEQPQEAPEE